MEITITHCFCRYKLGNVQMLTNNTQFFSQCTISNAVAIILSVIGYNEYFIAFYYYPVVRVSEEYDVYTYVHTFMKFVYTVIVHNVNNILSMQYTKTHRPQEFSFLT